jgi:flagellar hook-associated protein 1
LMLPTHGGQLSTIGASVQTGSFHPGGGIPPILLGGADVTSQLRGGRIGADLDIRDTIMPTYQAELDEFAETMATRFDAQGLTLFSDPSGTVPVSAPLPVQNGYVGFSVIIQVNPALLSTPSLLRDGTHPVVGNPAGPSAFVPNPPGGPAGFTAMIERVLNFALGPNAQNGVPQPPPNTANLGPTGTLNAPFTAPTTLSGFAGTIIGTQAQDAAHATSQLATEQAVQSALTAKFSSVSGVSMDTEMSHMIELQNAYGANARVIASVQAMWTQLLNAVS